MDRPVMASYGIDYDKGMKNCMGNPVFYKKVLKMFLDDSCFAMADEAYLKGDMKGLFNCMHELKGISGNAALTELYDKAVPLVEMLRSDKAARRDIEDAFSGIRSAYNKACEGIKLYLSEA